MHRPTKKEIKAAIDKLKDNSGSPQRHDPPPAVKNSGKKSSMRIRKQGV